MLRAEPTDTNRTRSSRSRDGDEGLILGFFARHGPFLFGSDPKAFDPSAVDRTMRQMSLFFGPRRWFRLDVRGFEHVPPAPVMVVSNHSGGTSIPDVWGFLYSWYEHFGTRRPVHPMAHAMILATRPTARWFAERGVLRASQIVSREVLVRCRRDLMVMPGGDLDTWRPWRRRFEVEFGGRTGYARLALETGVPIVPVANAGAHDTLLVLTDGRALARALRLKTLARAEVWPVHVSLPWGLVVGPVPHIPLPARLRYRIGAPIIPERCGGAPRDAQVEALDGRVKAAVQGLLDELARTR